MGKTDNEKFNMLIYNISIITTIHLYNINILFTNHIIHSKLKFISIMLM